MANNCQSCGMPMNKDPQKGGSEADGMLSQLYCSLCYREGGFIHPDFSVTQMQDHCATQLQAKGLPRIMAWLFTRGIPKLGRWKDA